MMHSKKPYSCKTCGRCYETHEMLQVHNIKAHTNLGHCCQFCDKSFRDAYDCRRHVRTQHLFPTIRNAAGVFRMDSGNVIHKRKGRTVHYCSDCNFKTKVRKHLHRHIRSKHSPKTPKMYVCEGDGCSFKHRFKSRYTLHIRTCKKFKVICQKQL